MSKRLTYSIEGGPEPGKARSSAKTPVATGVLDAPQERVCEPLTQKCCNFYRLCVIMGKVKARYYVRNICLGF